MKKIIPFKKEIVFKTNLAEVTSISLEHSLHVENDQLITGSFEVSGEYKISDNSATTDVFSFELPFDIEMDDRYDLSGCSVDIHDFYYEINLPPIPNGDDLGWNVDNGWIDLIFGSQLANDGTPCLVVKYMIEPRADYRNLM